MQKFLDKYDTVIFDMDGVITSEQNYWNCAALTVREFLETADVTGGRFSCHSRSRDKRTVPLSLRREVFCDDKLITILKGKGVNSNWDLGYVTVLISLITGTNNPQKILEFANTLSDNILTDYDGLAKAAAARHGLDIAYTRRNGGLWQELRDCFQRWYLGDGSQEGLINNEQPIIPMTDLKQLLSELSATKRVCTGTGRPAAEVIAPLTQWGVIKYFAPDGLCNYDHVQKAEKSTGKTLTKPNPYMFLKALYGTDYDDTRIINGDYDKAKISRTLIVGDAGADILAAKAMNADFCAVLTGIDGIAARSYFEKLGAEYILNSAADLI